MECIVLLLFVGWYWVMQQLYWRLCLVMECIVLLLFVGWYWVMQQLYWRLSCHGMYCFIIICWMVLGNAAAILETLSCHGMYCFIIICWLVLGNAAAILETVLSWNVLFYYYLLAGTG